MMVTDARGWLFAVTCAALVSESACSAQSTSPGEQARPQSAATPLVGVLRAASRDPSLNGVLSARTATLAGVDGEISSASYRLPSQHGFGGLGVRLDARADRRFDVGISRLARLRLSIAREHARDSAAELDGGRVVYRDAFPGTDVIVAANDDRFEELYWMREPTPVATYSWAIELPPGINDVRLEALGGASFVDRNGDAVLVVPRPFALDADGRRRDANLAWSRSDARSGRLTVTLDAEGLRFPVLLDPAIESFAWEKKSPLASPPASFGGLVYDSARARVVLFVNDYATSTIATWEWDGVNWSNKTPSGTKPSARATSGFAYDSVRRVSVMYGGRLLAAPNDYSSETWEWNAATSSWALRTSALPTRAEMGMVYETAKSRALAFGGYSGTATSTTLTTETSAYAGTAWSALTVTAPPLARSRPAIAYDSVRARTVLFGGADRYRNGLSDTWEWDGTTWASKTPSAIPTGRFSAALAYDSFRNKTVLFGGQNLTTTFRDTWEWNGTTWTQWNTTGLPAPAGSYPATAFDVARKQLVYYGGGAGNSETWVGYTRGGACTLGSQCETGYCVDGVCCDAPSCGTCQACNLAVTPGTCSKVLSAADTDSCAAPASCNAVGACVKGAGTACTAGTECVSGFCVDGVCCDRACTETCLSCKATLKASGADDGVCGPTKDGTDPRSQCPTDTSTTCKRDGMCDGLGACRNYASGTSCGSTTCSGNSVAGQVCDGLGACITSGGVDCAPGTCRASACSTTCTTDSDCATTGFCDAGTCVAKKDFGATCAAASACRSGFCVDGVCCNTACLGQCEACDVTGGLGSCVPVSGDPHGTRTKCDAGTPDNPCSKATCDGTATDKCGALAGSSVSCRTPSCADGVETLAAFCDGKGSCPKETKPCSPFACAGAACGTSCATSAECASGYRCDASKQCAIAGTCDGDHTTTGADKTTTDCSPYRCDTTGENAGSCKSVCATTSDCVAGYVCDTALGKCVNQPVTEVGGTNDDGGGCSTSRSKRGDGLFGLTLAALALVLQRRSKGAAR